MKPRIFINMHYMELGGAERALLGLLYAIDTEKVDVDLFINQHTGPFMKLIPEKINLLPEIPIYSAIERPMITILKEGHYSIFYRRIVSKIKYRFFLWKNKIKSDATIMQFLYDEVIKSLPSLHYLGEYDLAISFIDPPHIVQDKVLAKKRLEWIHTDFSSRQRNYDAQRTFSRWAGNDYVVSISDEVSEAFSLAFPMLTNKLLRIDNVIPQKLVIAQSTLYKVAEYREDELNICSVGRLAPVKNFDSIPAIAKCLVNIGFKFHWWIIGPGDVNEYNDLAKKHGVDDFVSYIGPKDNPYPYIRDCDIYVQPSRREGKSITVQEAQMLGKPVIITRYPTSASQVADGEDGIICEMENESVAETIISLGNDRARMTTLGRKAAEMHRGNDNEVKKLYDILGI